MTSFVLPASLPSAAGWQLYDWRALSYTSPAAGADGTCTITCAQVDPAELWLIDHLVVACTSSRQTTVTLYENTVTPAARLDGSSAGNLNSNDWPNGLLLRPSTTLLAQWTNASAGAVATLRLQARIMRQAGS